MLYENSRDRERQALVVKKLQEHTDKTLVETPRENPLSHDFNAFNEDNLLCGIGEIKVRSRDSGFFRKCGWLLDIERIEALQAYATYLQVPVLLILYTTDDRIFKVRLEDVVEKLSTMKRAPDHWMRDNHGKLLSKRNGVIIPFELLTELRSK